MFSIYNILLIMLIALAAAFFIAGLYNFALILLKVPSWRTTQAIRKIAPRNRPNISGMSTTYNEISLFISKFIRLNEYSRKQWEDNLRIANVPMTPEVYIARALTKSVGVALLAIPVLFIMPVFSILILILAVLIFAQEKQRLDNYIKEKRKQIEYDLPNFAAAIVEELKMTHDVLAILERHKDSYSSYFNEEIAITIADMRTGNYEAAITRFESRIGSTSLSEVCRGFIEMIRGSDTVTYWQTLSERFMMLKRAHLQEQANKIPPKVHRMSFFLMMSMMLLYIVVLGYQLLDSIGILFG